MHLSMDIIEDVSIYWFYTHQILFFNNMGIDTVTCVHPRLSMALIDII